MMSSAQGTSQADVTGIGIVGVIGLGNMGLGMAAAPARAGFTVLGYDLDAGRRAAAELAGVQFRSVLADVLQSADAFVFSLPYARDVEAVVTAPGGLLERHDRRTVTIDTSTSDPATTRRLAARLAQAGHAFLDAPVSDGAQRDQRSDVPALDPAGDTRAKSTGS